MTNRKLVAWCALVGALAAIGYAQRFSAGKPPRNALYHWDIAIGEVITYLIIFGFFYWIARGLSWDQLGLRKPKSWPRALGLGVAIFICVFIAESALEPVLHPSREQGLEPTRWEPSHAGAFAVSAFAVVVLGPIVEELLFRGLVVECLSQTCVDEPVEGFLLHRDQVRGGKYLRELGEVMTFAQNVGQTSLL